MRNSLLMITALVMLFAACSKDEPRGEKIILSEMSQIETDIIDFLEKMDDQHEGSLPVADVVFFLDAGFNYRYAHIGNDTAFTTTRIDTSYVNLEVFEGYSTYTEMKTAFNDIYDEMAVLFEAIDDDEKALSIIHLNHVSENTLQVISVWRYSLRSFDGDWLWGWKHGKCNNTNFGHDATDAILFYYNMNYASTPGHGIWTNKSFSNIHLAQAQIMEISGNPNQFGYEDRLLFKHVQPTQYVSHCMTQSENYYYASKLPSAIAAIVNYEGITKDLMHVFFVYHQVFLSPPDNHSIQHGIQTMHGDWNSIIHPPKTAFWAHQ